jgi:hypothetical protein
VQATGNEYLFSPSEELFAFTLRLSLDPSLQPGGYRLQLTLLDPESGAPLNIVADDGHLIDDELFLAPVQVQP